MAFTLYLGNTPDDTIVANKTATFTIEKTIAPLDTVDVLNPYIIIDYSSSIMNCNYAKIPDFNERYYYVRPELLTSGRIGLTLTVDPLMSWYNRGVSSGIKDITTTIVRTGSLNKPTYTQDELLPVDTGRFSYINIKEFSNTPHGVLVHNVPTIAAGLIVHTI